MSSPDRTPRDSLRQYLVGSLPRTAVAFALALLALAPAAPVSASGRPLPATLSVAEETAAARLGRTNATVPLGVAPFYTVGSKWATSELRRWNSGFLPGSLWYEYQRSGEASWAAAARRRQQPLESLATYGGTPDIACIGFDSYVRGYRLTGGERARRLGLTAASTLAARYSAKIGMVKAHGTGSYFRTIVDQMMNTELLFWAADNGGSAAWREMAARHALRTAKDLQRPDGSTYHYATYSMSTGALLARGTLAGASDSSTWSRGQAWFIYGMTAGYRETGDVRLLAAARKAIDYWTSHVPEDGVPYWDFQAPGIPDAPRDSSAAAIAASALVELSGLDPDAAKRSDYLRVATDTLESLASPEYLAADPSSPSVLVHGTYSANVGAVDHGTIWGDYFFREALMRLGSAVRRVDGPDRYLSAVRASQVRFLSADAVVLASGETYADALSASGLAGVLKAPVLLTRAGVVPSAVLGEIARLHATRVVIVGGRASVGDAVVRAIRARAVGVERVGGSDRYEVAANVARAVLTSPGASSRAFVVRGDAYPDALSVSPVAWATGAPVLLTRPASLSVHTRAVLAHQGIKTVTIVGGEGSVSKSTANAIAAVTRGAPERIAGPDRYSTASAFAEWAVRSGLASARDVGVATGADFPDALAGGAAVGAGGGVMLLTKRSELTPTTRDWLRRRRVAESRAAVYGGPASVSEPVEASLDRIVTFGR